MAINLLALEPHKVSRDLSGYITYLYGVPKVGKAQPVDTIIPTPDGMKRLGDIKPGDYVFNRHGKPIKVIEIFPQGLLDEYKVELADGRITYCNDQHLWTYFTSRDNFKTITTREMIDKGVIDNHGRCRYSIPTNKALNFHSENELPIPPYVVGAFLGDGCCKERLLTLSSENSEIPSLIGELLNCIPHKVSSNNFNWIFKLKEPITAYYNNLDKVNIATADIFKQYETEIMTSSDQKRIPKEYLFASVEARMELLRGLLDTDGAIAASDDYAVKFTTISPKLAEDFIFLCGTLGFKTTVTMDKRVEKYKNGLCFSIRVCVDNKTKQELFALTRKRERALSVANKPYARKTDRIQIKNIEATGKKVDMVCILVDDPEHLYLTNDFIVTHNTSLAVNTGRALLLAFEKGYNALPGVVAQDITKWSEMKMVLRELKKAEVKERFDIVVVDTVDLAGAFCEKYVCQQNDVETINQIPFGKGWGMMKAEFEAVFREVTQLG